MATSMRSAFDGQVVLITGASSGIGAALAREFARAGAHTVLVARRAERIEALAAELTSGSRRSLAVAGDVARDGEVERAVQAAVSHFGRLDAVAANAGVLVTGKFENLTVDDYRRQMETNTFGALRTVYAALPALRATHGRIVLVGSLLGVVSVPGVTPYCMSKFALEGLAGGLRIELAPAGVSVTHVLFGYVDTEIYAGVAMRRKPGRWMTLTPEEAARGVVGAAYRRQRSRIFPWAARMAGLLQRYWPALTDFILTRAYGRLRG